MFLYYWQSIKMEDHQYYGSDVYVGEKWLESEEISLEEKDGDAFLIELYRARPFLYDKGHKDFKNKNVKDNAWNEISKIMLNKNYGNLYTSDYCQKRCTSLRNQYCREKRLLDSQYKSGSGASSHKPFPFYNQLSFLNIYIKRRRTYNNIQANNSLTPSTSCAEVSTEILKSNSNEVLELNEKSNDSIHDENQNSNDEKNKETTSNITQKRVATEKYSDMVHTKPKYKKSKVDETKEFNNIFSSVSQKIINALDNKENDENEAFAQFIVAHLAKFSQSQQNIKKKMITDALFSPLQEM